MFVGTLFEVVRIFVAIQFHTAASWIGMDDGTGFTREERVRPVKLTSSCPAMPAELSLHHEAASVIDSIVLLLASRMTVVRCVRLSVGDWEIDP
jgi:hypothetical protein